MQMALASRVRRDPLGCQAPLQTQVQQDSLAPLDALVLQAIKEDKARKGIKETQELIRQPPWLGLPLLLRLRLSPQLLRLPWPRAPQTVWRKASQGLRERRRRSSRGSRRDRPNRPNRPARFNWFTRPTGSSRFTGRCWPTRRNWATRSNRTTRPNWSSRNFNCFARNSYLRIA